MERKIHFRENMLIFLGIWGETKLILRIWGAKEKNYQGTEEFSFSGIWGDKCIIFRDQGSADPPSCLASVMYAWCKITVVEFS